jgi:hypothetical protein
MPALPSRSSLLSSLMFFTKQELPTKQQPTPGALEALEEKEDCPICCETYDTESRLRATLPSCCGQPIILPCTTAWLHQKHRGRAAQNTCPLCRREICRRARPHTDALTMSTYLLQRRHRRSLSDRKAVKLFPVVLLVIAFGEVGLGGDRTMLGGEEQYAGSANRAGNASV